MDIIKQVVGVDVSKNTLAVCYGTVDQQQNQEITEPVIFNNDLNGFRESMSFTKKKKDNLKQIYILLWNQQVSITRTWLIF